MKMLDDITEKTEALIRAYRELKLENQRLREENTSLQRRENALRSENQNLLEQQSQAKGKLERIISNLKQLEVQI